MSKLRDAIRKAQESRGSTLLAPAQETPTEFAVPGGTAQEETSDSPHREHLDPEYTRTRVSAVDLVSLTRSKILSVLRSGEVPDRVRMLRTQVLQRLAEIGGNSFLVTSAGPREGKTFTAANLAVSIAQELNRTALLVDADIRKPSVHEYFHLGSPAGLSDYLLGAAELESLFINPGIPRLTILPAGNRLENSAELLSSPRMAALTKEMKERYPERVLIFDTPSLLTTADALVFSRYMDAVLFVVEAERASSRDVLRALDLLGDKPILGVVYNKTRDA